MAVEHPTTGPSGPETSESVLEKLKDELDKRQLVEVDRLQDEKYKRSLLSAVTLARCIVEEAVWGKSSCDSENGENRDQISLPGVGVVAIGEVLGDIYEFIQETLAVKSAKVEGQI